MDDRKEIKVSELKDRIQRILDIHRCEAYEAVRVIMANAFQKIARVLLTEERLAGSDITFDKMVCGLSADAMKDILRHGENGDGKEWLEGLFMENPSKPIGGQALRLLMEFLDFERMRMASFKAKYPNAFLKWKSEDDERLLKEYGEALVRNGGTNITRSDWNRLSADFGRNVNAIRLRLGDLGLDLGKDAGQSRRQ